MYRYSLSLAFQVFEVELPLVDKTANRQLSIFEDLENVERSPAWSLNHPVPLFESLTSVSFFRTSALSDRSDKRSKALMYARNIVFVDIVPAQIALKIIGRQYCR